MAVRLPALFYRVAYQLFNIYIFIFRPRLRGMQCFVEYEGRFLLVRHSYGSSGWKVPGGNMGDDEEPEEAARRELKEEVGIEPEELRRLTGGSLAPRRRQPRTIYFHAVVRTPHYEISSGEIEDARWFTTREALRLLTLKERYLIRRHHGRG